jgi:uncharacterized protein (TIGR00369 family)
MSQDTAIGTEALLRSGRSSSGLPIPLHQTLGISILRVTEGELIARLPASAQLRDAGGVLAPGCLAVLADVCCGAAVATGLPRGKAAMTAQLRVEFVKPIPLGVRWLEGRARLDSVDEQGGLARSELVDDRDELLGVASLRSLSSTGRRITPEVATDAPSHRTVPHNEPLAAFLGQLSGSVGDGRAEWVLAPGRPITNSFNAVHGGVVALMAHAVATDAQHSVLAPGEYLVPLDLALNYYRGGPVGDRPWTACAEVTHRGRRFVVADGQILRADGRPAVRFSVGAQVRSG